MSHIPVINIAALLKTDPSQWCSSATSATSASSSSPTPPSDDARAAVEAILDACTGVGFFYVTGHGLDADDLIKRMSAASHSFFNQPKKGRTATSGGASPRSYVYWCTATAVDVQPTPPHLDPRRVRTRASLHDTPRVVSLMHLYHAPSGTCTRITFLTSPTPTPTFLCMG